MKQKEEKRSKDKRPILLGCAVLLLMIASILSSSLDAGKVKC
jgi:hypothetical protein